MPSMVAKRSVPPETVKHLAELRRASEDAQEAYKQAVADALKAGASVRGVVRATGLSSNTVTLWGRDRGWPTAEQKRLEAENKARTRAWEAILAHEDPRQYDAD